MAKFGEKMAQIESGPQDLIFGQLVGYIGTPSSTPNQTQIIPFRTNPFRIDFVYTNPCCLPLGGTLWYCSLFVGYK